MGKNIKRIKRAEKGQEKDRKRQKNIHSLDGNRAREFANTPFLLCIITFCPEAEYKPTYATC